MNMAVQVDDRITITATAIISNANAISTFWRFPSSVRFRKIHTIWSVQWSAERNFIGGGVEHCRRRRKSSVWLHTENTVRNSYNLHFAPINCRKRVHGLIFILNLFPEVKVMEIWGRSAKNEMVLNAFCLWKPPITPYIQQPHYFTMKISTCSWDLW